MTAISKSLPGWFRRGKSGDGSQSGGEDQARTESDTDAAAGTHAQEEHGPAGASVPLTGGDGETEPVVVFEARNRMEAEIVKGHLESEGIPAIITGDVAGRIFGLNVGNLAKASVLVPAPLADRALEVLDAAADETDLENEDDADHEADAEDDAAGPEGEAGDASSKAGP